MRSKTLLSALALLIGLAVVLFRPNEDATNAGATAGAPSASVSTTTGANASKPEAPSAAKTGTPAKGSGSIGFGSARALDEHFEKHGPEFGSITQSEYLALAQKLRDAPAGGAILEAVRDDGVISRFDKKSGAFLAFNENKTIRTFFKPNDGVRYFERQIEKSH